MRQGGDGERVFTATRKSADGKKYSLSYIREGWSENSVGGKGFRGNGLGRPLTLQRQEKWVVWQQNIFLGWRNPLEIKEAFFRVLRLGTGPANDISLPGNLAADATWSQA